MQTLPGGVRVGSAPGCRILAERGEFHLAPDWYWNFRHRVESARGLDDVEDLFVPGRFTLRLAPGESTAIVLTTEDGAIETSARAHEVATSADLDLVRGLAPDAPEWIRQLTLAADQFLVARRGEDGSTGATVIAGYPWFTDWGRDTMIALPGLALATGRIRSGRRHPAHVRAAM